MECFWCGRISVLAAPGNWMDDKSKGVEMRLVLHMQ